MRREVVQKPVKQVSIAWKRGGFTLVEILLVVVLIGISLGVSVPIFARSVRGARLRQSGRMVLAMHRQARSKAVLGQCYASLFFDERLGTVELFTQSEGAQKDSFFDTLGGGGAAGGGEGGGATGVQPVSTAVKALEEGVRIASFRGGADVDGIHYVQYFPNGMCEEWTLGLEDADGRSMRLSADPVTGQAVADE